MSGDDDATRRVSLRVVRAGEPTKPKRTPNAEAAARYRARKRGEDAPRRKRGPARTTVTDLRAQIRERDARIRDMELHERLLREQVRRQISTLTVERVAQELLDVLRRDDPARDTAERRTLLGDVLAEIEDRHQHWRE